MRMPFSKTALAGVLTLVTAATSASAQVGRASVGADDLGQPQWAEASAPHSGGPPPAGWGAGPIGVPGAMFKPQYGTMPPQALYPPHAPNTMNPWPEVSPFYPPNVSYTQHQNKRGLWFKDTVHRDTDYEFGIEYILTSFEEPEDRIVGSNFQPLINAADGSLDPQGPRIITYNLGPEMPIDTASFVFPGAHPFPFLLQPDLSRLAIVDGSLFPIHTTGALAGGLDSNGIKLRWGAMHEDGTGWAASGFFAPETQMQFQRGTDNIFGQPISQTMLLTFDGFPQENSAIIFTRNGALPLIYSDDLFGLGHVPGFLGETQKFDLLYRIEQNTTAAGTELNRYTGIWRKTENTRITTFVGARYFYLGETFSFRGLDSGFGYEFESTGTGGGGGGGNQQANLEIFRPDFNSIIVDYPLLDARLNSSIDSHMAGAQAGFRLDIGHHGAFHLWTQTTGGLLANYESLEVNGNNIGLPGIGQHPEMHDGVQFLDNSFRDKERHTHVSPLFEQSIYADIRLKHVLPFLKKSYMLEEAQFRVGYTFTWIGGISRPGNSINWVGFPKFPSVKINRENFTMNQMSLGLTFPY